MCYYRSNKSVSKSSFVQTIAKTTYLGTVVANSCNPWEASNCSTKTKMSRWMVRTCSTSSSLFCIQESPRKTIGIINKRISRVYVYILNVFYVFIKWLWVKKIPRKNIFLKHICPITFLHQSRAIVLRWYLVKKKLEISPKVSKKYPFSKREVKINQLRKNVEDYWKFNKKKLKLYRNHSIIS